MIEVKLRLWTTSPDGIPYIGKAANARRRYLAKRWFNTEWRNRIRGIGVFLAGGGQRLTRTPEPFPVSLGAGATVLVASQPIRVLVTPSLDEAMLESVRRRFGPRAGGEADHVAGA